jgi:hypothetical protein
MVVSLGLLDSLVASLWLQVYSSKILYRKSEQILPAMQLRGLISNSNIHVSVSDLRGVLGNKCAGPHTLKTVQVREIIRK